MQAQISDTKKITNRPHSPRLGLDRFCRLLSVFISSEYSLRSKAAHGLFCAEATIENLPIFVDAARQFLVDAIARSRSVSDPFTLPRIRDEIRLQPICEPLRCACRPESRF